MVVIVVSIIACKVPSFWLTLTTSDGPNLYLSKPTRVAKYLRSVLALWLVNGEIDIRYVLPTSYLESGSMEDVSSDSDSEEEIEIETPKLTERAAKNIHTASPQAVFA